MKLQLTSGGKIRRLLTATGGIFLASPDLLPHGPPCPAEQLPGSFGYSLLAAESPVECEVE